MRKISCISSNLTVGDNTNKLFALPDDLRHENISNDLQTTCRTFEVQLKKLRAENECKENEIAKLKAIILKNETMPSESAEVKELKVKLATVQNELNDRRLQEQDSFQKVLKEMESDENKDLENLSERGDSKRIEDILLTKSVSKNLKSILLVLKLFFNTDLQCNKS